MGFLTNLFTQREKPVERAAWLDQTVRSVASAAQQHFLAELRTARRSFDAAETPAWTESWPTTAAPINDDLSRQLPTMRARAQGLARNAEWAIGYLIKLEDHVLGENGIPLQMRLTHGDGSANTPVNKRLEDAFARWGARADVSGLTWREVETLALTAEDTDGELLYRLRPGAGPFGFQIQMLDPALLDVTLSRDWQGRRVRMGVEIDDDGAPVAYWLNMSKTGDSAPDLMAVGRHVRIPASQIRHRFIRHVVGQLRGYPELAGGARRLWLLKDFEEAAAVASSNAAKRQGFFVTKDGEAPRGFADTVISSVLDAAKAAGKVLTPDEIQAITSAAEKYSTTLPGQFDSLPFGTEFQKYESSWPNIEAATYIKGHLRGWSAARGMSYVTLGNDLESVNYSSARVGIVGEREHFRARQTRLIDWLHADVFAAVLPYLVLKTAGLQPVRVDAYLAAAHWQPRRWAGIDPVKEATASEINLRLRLTSRRRLISERGEDPDEIAEEVAREEALYGALDQENTPRPQDAPEEDEEAAAGKKAIRRAPLVAVRGSFDN
jgi:lambda family phage portal protein